MEPSDNSPSHLMSMDLLSSTATPCVYDPYDIFSRWMIATDNTVAREVSEQLRRALSQWTSDELDHRWLVFSAAERIAAAEKVKGQWKGAQQNLSAVIRQVRRAVALGESLIVVYDAPWHKCAVANVMLSVSDFINDALELTTYAQPAFGVFLAAQSLKEMREKTPDRPIARISNRLLAEMAWYAGGKSGSSQFTPEALESMVRRYETVTKLEPDSVIANGWRRMMPALASISRSVTVHRAAAASRQIP